MCSLWKISTWRVNVSKDKFMTNVKFIELLSHAGYVKRPKPSPEAEPLVPPSYNCQQCGKGFRREAALRRHLEFDHRAKSDSEDEEEDEVSVKADPDALDPDVYQPPSHQSHHAISGREQIIQKASAGNTVSNEPRPHACPHCRQTFKVVSWDWWPCSCSTFKRYVPQCINISACDNTIPSATHVFVDESKNMNDIFNDYVCSVSHAHPELHFENV